MKADARTSGDTMMVPKHHHHFSLDWATHLGHQHRHRAPADDADSERVRTWQERQMQRRQLIQDTISHRLLETHVQPIVDLRSGRQVGAEALSRFTGSPTRSPDQWFADAAAVGLGVELELLAVEVALGQLELLPADLYLSLNVSTATVLSGQLPTVLADVASERIVLELTGDVPLDDFPTFDQRMTELRARGLRMAIDDAGTGTSSFERILQVKPDIIKLDIGLTRGIDVDPARRSFGRALLNFGLDSCGASLIAEGIETQSELDTLRALGCPTGQGYLLGRPHRATMRYLAPFTSFTPPQAEPGSLVSG